MVRVAFIVITPLVVLLSASPSRAERVGVVTVTPVQAPVGKAELDRAIRLAATGAGHQVLADPVETARGNIANGAVVLDRLRPFARAEAMLKEGWRSYAQVQMEVAKQQLVAARQAALEVADLAGGVALVAETSLRLGVIEFELNELGAAADFRLAYRLAPGRAVTDDEFKPAVVSAFRAAIAAPAVKRPVSINVNPATSTIEIDGTARAGGEAPELEIGLHLFVVRASGMIAAGNLVVVENTGAANLTATLAPEPLTAGLFAGNVELATSSTAASKILESAVLFAELDAVVVVAAAWRDGSMLLVGQKCGGSPLVCTPEVAVPLAEPGAIAVAASALVATLDRKPRNQRDVSVPTSEVVANSRRPEQGGGTLTRRPWWKNRWLWIGVGAAAVAAGTTAVVLSIDGDSPLVIDTDPCEFGGCP